MPRDARPAAAWFTLAAAGFAAALALLYAPPSVAYPHYRLTAADPVTRLALALLAANTLLLLTVGRSHVVAVGQWAKGSLGSAGMMFLAFAMLALTVAPSRNPREYLTETLFATAVQLVAALVLAAAVRSCPDRTHARIARVVDGVLGPSEPRGPTRPDRWSLVVAAGAAAAAALLAVLAYQRHPHVPDEVAYLLQARYLAEGMLTMPSPPVPAAFNIDLLHYETARWYSPVPPGWPFMLAIGAWLGVPWLVNPVLAGIAILLAYCVLGTMYDRRTTRLATLLLASSPWMLFMAMNFMTHTLTLVCALAAALGVARARATGSSPAAFVAGLATGAVSLIRPLEGLAVALLMGLWSLGARGRLFRLAPSVALVTGSVAAAALVRPYNAMLTGSPSVFPIMAYIDKYYAPGSNELGFGPNRGLGWGGLDPLPGHGPIDVVVNAALNLSQINVELLGWPTGAILVVGLAFALGLRGLSRADWWQVAAVAVVAGLHSFYWFSGGPDFGARYWFLVIVPCIALAARGITRLEREAVPSTPHRAPLAHGTALALMLVALALYVPWRSVGKYRHYRGMRPDVRVLARQHDFGESLVLVRGRRHPDYASAATYNPIDLRADAPVYAWDASPAIREAVLDAYPDRPIWILDGPSITGDGYRVAAGPITAAEARVSTIRPSAAGDERHVYDPVASRSAQTPP